MMLETLQRKLWAYQGYRGIFDCDCDCADYSGVANAANNANVVSEKLGQDQLAEARRQYDTNLAVSKPVVDAQLELMEQAKQQGDDYYNYMVSRQRPVEDALNAEAMSGQPDDATKLAMDNAAATAVADARQGTTQQQNQLIRQGMRYGLTPAQLGLKAGSLVNGAALNEVTAANAARTQEGARSWAKKLDVAGLYRGMPGASQGAYGVANQSGNSAVANQLAPGQTLMAGLTQGTNTIQQGLGMKVNGLLGAANGIQNGYNNRSGDGGLGGLGSLLGGAASLYTAFSSKEFKDDKKPVDAELITRGLQRIPVEAWRYKDGVADGGEHIGPYAEDVQKEFGDTAAPGGKVIDLVSMNGISLAVGKSNADRLDRIEKKLGLERRK